MRHWSRLLGNNNSKTWTDRQLATGNVDTGQPINPRQSGGPGARQIGDFGEDTLPDVLTGPDLAVLI